MTGIAETSFCWLAADKCQSLKNEFTLPLGMSSGSVLQAIREQLDMHLSRSPKRWLMCRDYRHHALRLQTLQSGKVFDLEWEDLHFDKTPPGFSFWAIETSLNPDCVDGPLSLTVVTLIAPKMLRKTVFWHDKCGLSGSLFILSQLFTLAEKVFRWSLIWNEDRRACPEQIMTKTSNIIALLHQHKIMKLNQ